MYKYLTCVVTLITLLACSSNSKSPGFAIVIDPESYNQAKAEVDNYAQSIENQGLKTFIVVDVWQNPDSIRAKLIEMYNDKDYPIEGAVFIGDIPIPMLRDAQHFASAFKMDQDRFAWDRSSIPSDRFYDDFDLSFKFLKEDEKNQLYFYYSLTAESDQILRPEIYTGRIKPFESDHKYEDLKKYLRKVVRIKAEDNAFDQIIFFGGHGYNSESMIARMDEKINMYDQFPQLKQAQSGIGYIDHSMEEHIKPRLMSELQRNDLDIALLHHHGGDDAQYLSGMPQVDGVTQQIFGIKYYLRSKIRAAERRGQNVNEVKKDFMDRLGVPSAWFDGSFDKKVTEEDSIYNRMLDIYTPDVMAFTPNARVVILDACYNGSFHLGEYISGAYIFNDGNTVTVQANSVNVLQDKWSNEFLGLLGMGVRFGNWSKHVSYIETHVIGDPTFQFKTTLDVSDINLDLLNHRGDVKFWLSQLDSEYAEIQALALRKLLENNYAGLSDLLLETYKTNAYGEVRMECLKLLTSFNDDNFIACLTMATNDAYELVRRQAAYLIGRSGDDRLIEPLLLLAMRNNTADRVDFATGNAMDSFDREKLKASFNKLFDENTHFTQPEEVKKELLRVIVPEYNTWKRYSEEILNPESTPKAIISDVRSLRNTNYHPRVEEFCALAKETDNDDIRIVLIEAFGWFNISHKKDILIATCKEIIAGDKYSDVAKNEALKTVNRLESKWYR